MNKEEFKKVLRLVSSKNSHDKMLGFELIRHRTDIPDLWFAYLLNCITVSDFGEDKSSREEYWKLWNKHRNQDIILIGRLTQEFDIDNPNHAL